MLHSGQTLSTEGHALVFNKGYFNLLIHVHIHVHAYVRTYIHTYIHMHIHTYMYTYIHRYAYTVHTYIHTYIHTHVLYIHTCIHTYIHMTMCIHTYMHRTWTVLHNVTAEKCTAAVEPHPNRVTSNHVRMYSTSVFPPVYLEQGAPPCLLF